jgi:hypothetical protein
LVAFLEVKLQVYGPLLEQGDLLVEFVDVGWRAEAGLAPGVFTECFGEALLEALDVAGQSACALVRGEQVGLQGKAADTRAGGGSVGCLALDRVEFGSPD